MTGSPSPENAPNRQEQRSAQTRRRVCAAAIACLDERGYSETSIQRVQERAGVSRGALMHQFATKEDMIVETLRRVLASTRHGQGLAGARRGGDGGGASMERDLLSLWSHLVDRPEGRAMVEILVAARTDARLRAKIEPLLRTYEAEIGQDVLEIYESAGGSDEDVIQIWAICRIFMRSLHLQQRFDPDPEAARAMVRRFAELVAPHLRRRDPPPADGD
ncbi:MAG: TetR/AcrR family transcriptional regulator [Rhodobacteraceae bacterium]|nr:TetR/AcrR family transcriptional regulator [Paracoccaceae bacterium]